MNKKVKKNKYKIIIVSTILLICIVGTIFSIINIISWKKDANANKKIKEKLEEHTAIDEEKDNYKIDFKALKEINEDTIAFIEVKGTNINYVVVKGKDNSYYLKHNFNKKYNRSGWIFVDCDNKLDGSDKNIIIYGHNTKDGTMFETLINVLDKNWQEKKENQIITLVTEKGKYKYQTFSTYEIEPETYYLKTSFNNESEYTEFLKTIKSRSNYNYKVDLNKSNKILTLSSCIGEGQKRVVLHAKLIEIEV